jgi:hypothetical protein
VTHALHTRICAVALTALVATPALPVHAEPTRAAVAVLTLPHEDVPDVLVERLLLSFDRGLQENAQLEVKDASKLLADFSGEVPTQEVESARLVAKEGQTALDELRTREATQKLTEAVKRLEPVLPFIHKQELADAALGLAVAQALEGNMAAARATFLDLLVWRPKVEHDTEHIPPDLMKLYEDSKREVARLPKGTLDVRSDPDGAQAFVDGRFVGITPCTATDLTQGRHFIAFKKDGYLKTVVRTQIPGRRLVSVISHLKRSEKYLLLEQSIERARAAFGQDKADQSMVDLRSFLFIDHAIFVQFSRADDGRVDMQAAVYDLRSRRRLSLVHDVPTEIRAERAAENMAHSLYTGVTYDGSLAPTPENLQTYERRKAKPFYSRWWFWTAVGVAAAAAVVIPLEALPEDRSTPGYRPTDIKF